jgi:hypothetical protein
MKMMYSNLQFIKSDIVNSKSYRRMDENERFVSYRSNLGMIRINKYQTENRRDKESRDEDKKNNEDKEIITIQESVRKEESKDYHISSKYIISKIGLSNEDKTVPTCIAIIYIPKVIAYQIRMDEDIILYRHNLFPKGEWVIKYQIDECVIYLLVRYRI